MVLRSKSSQMSAMRIKKGMDIEMVKRGDVYIAQLDPVIGSEQGGIRPVVVVQNDSGNLCSTTVIAAVTGKNKKLYLPTHVKVGSRDIVLWDSSVIMLEQIRTLDKSRLIKYIGRLSQETIHKIDEAFLKSVGALPALGGALCK